MLIITLYSSGLSGKKRIPSISSERSNADLPVSELEDPIEALVSLRDERDLDLQPEEDADAEDDAATVALAEPEDRRRIAAMSLGLSEIDP
ncbi:MAG TPA: hypothetical protein VMA37_14505 [Acetobacteraceae bacterium]|nr:hypothetical protein [Acetobacteraceae bacterium]